MLSQMIKNCILFLLIIGTAFPVLAGDDAPAWLRQAAMLNPSISDKEAKAAVLNDETRITVAEDGKILTVTTWAVRS